MKTLTYDQVEARKEKAARFVDNVLDDPERADEIEEESVESYAERRNFIIENPRRETTMTKTEQAERIEELEAENEELQETLDKVFDLAAGDEIDDDEEEDPEEEAEDGNEYEDAA